MKYTKLSNKLLEFFVRAIAVLMILIMLGLAGVFLWVDLSYSLPMVSLMWLLLLPALGLAINWNIGKFFGDEYYNTDLVIEGRSVYDVVKTPKYYTRRMFVCFIECFLFALLIIRFIFLPSMITSLLAIVGSITGIIIYFIVGMSSYEQSSIKNKKQIKEKVEEKPKVEKAIEQKKKVHKFKFDNYPELLEKYNTFKLWNSKKIYDFENLDDKKNVLNEKDKAFESLALAVFNTFNEIKPKLIIKKTGQMVSWDEVINKPFEELSYLEKLILVRLLDRLYKYVLQNNFYNL